MVQQARVVSPLLFELREPAGVKGLGFVQFTVSFAASSPDLGSLTAPERQAILDTNMAIELRARTGLVSIARITRNSRQMHFAMLCPAVEDAKATAILRSHKRSRACP
jgi:hypothetical protein